jgi:hypothetical protein
MTSCTIERADNGSGAFEFDVEAYVTLTLLFPERYLPQLKEGFAVEFFEGSKKVAQGVVVEML